MSFCMMEFHVPQAPLPLFRNGQPRDCWNKSVLMATGAPLKRSPLKWYNRLIGRFHSNMLQGSCAKRITAFALLLVYGENFCKEPRSVLPIFYQSLTENLF